MGLPKRFPFRDVFEEFLAEYEACPTYWYIPKARILNDENVAVSAAILHTIFEHFLDRRWDVQAQADLLDMLVKAKHLDPYVDDPQLVDATALIRIWKKVLDNLGLLWVGEEGEVTVTDAGFELIAVPDDPARMRSIVEGQIAKLQYPNPSLAGPYRDEFGGILAHLFLLQVLRECDNRISYDEYELFLNLADDQDDAARIVRYIHSWRDLDNNQRDQIVALTSRIPMNAGPGGQLSLAEEYEAEGPPRHRRVRLDAGYQRSFFAYPSYLALRPDEQAIVCVAPEVVDVLVQDQLSDLKITKFSTLEDWFAYYGDPAQQPSWFTFLAHEVRDSASRAEARGKVQPHRDVVENVLTEDETEELERLEIEKGIEDFYVERLALLEVGLTLVGRQYSTPIGRIDLLCQAEDGTYVVVEIKAVEARDSVFGQILRYIGWVSRAFEDADRNVRGIIVASGFPNTAHYSRLGVLRDDYKAFLRFKEYVV